MYLYIICNFRGYLESFSVVKSSRTSLNNIASETNEKINSKHFELNESDNLNESNNEVIESSKAITKEVCKLKLIIIFTKILFQA